jgi:hypothetical protein
MQKEQIQRLIEDYGLKNILADHNLTMWKVLEILDNLGYIYLERYEQEDN